MTVPGTTARFDVLKALTLIGWVVGSLAAGPCQSQTAAGGNEARWVLAGNLSVERYFHTATLLPNGKVLVTGGRGNHGLHRSAELYDPATGKWTATGDMNTARTEHRATLLPNGKVLVVGGDLWNIPAVAHAAELYDPATGTWAYASPPAIVRRDHTVTLLQNGKVLVAGGFSSPDLHFEPAAELYDPLADTWHRTGRLATERGLHQATLLKDGRVLVTGGYGPGGSAGGVVTDAYPFHSLRLASAELFDPTSERWSPTDDVPHARDWHTATRLPDGHVLVAGMGNVAEVDATGDFRKSDRVSSLYDPATGHWRDAGTLNTGRGWHTATLLPDGDVLIAGGVDRPGSSDFVNVFNSAELYNSRGGVWTKTSNLHHTRAGHTATLLPNGKVLVVGGTLYTDGGINWGATTELYEARTVNVDAAFTGSWFDPGQDGHGFALEVLPGEPMRLLASWFTFAPQGGQAWIVGLGPINGDRAVLRGFQSVGPGGRFPPNFDAANVYQQDWGTLTFTFSDCNHGRVDWNSTAPGYGSGSMHLTRLTLPAGLTCDNSGMGYWDY